MAHSMTGKVKAANDVIKELKGLVLMRKLSSSFLLLVVAGCVLTGCGQSILREAEALLETDLKAADSILASMPMPKSRRDRAWYAVLKTQADYKNYRPLTDNSLILSATEYYGTKHKGYQAAMAWYSLGCSYTDANNDLAAIDAYLKARDLFPDTLIRYYALTEQNLGKHYLNRMMLPEATEQYKCCLANAIRLNDGIVQKNAIYNLGRCALYGKDFPTADSIFSHILTDSTSTYDQKNIAIFQLSKIRLHHDKDYPKALELINEHLHYLKNPENYGAGLSVKADIFNEMGQFDSAYHYYSKSLDYNNDINTVCSNYDHLMQMAIELGHKDEATQYYNGYKNTADSIYELRNQEQIKTLESEHKTELAENQLHNRTVRLTIIIVSFILISIMLAIIAVIYYRNWKKEKIWRIRDSINQTESDLLNKKLPLFGPESADESKLDYAIDKTGIVELYSKELKECCLLFQLQDVYSLMSGKSALRDVELTQDEKVQIIKTLNDCFRPVLQFLFDEIPDIKRDEAYVCILSYMGYNSVQISRLLDVTDGCIRQRRKRAQDKDSNKVTQIFFTEKA